MFHEDAAWFLADEDETPGAHPVVVLSHGLWERRFGSNPSLVGQTLVLNRQPFTVVGVAPSGFTGTFFGEPDLWVPMMMHDVAQPGFDWYGTRRGLFLFLIGRLKPNVNLDEARSAMTGLARQLEEAYPNDNRGRALSLLPLLEARLNPDGEGRLVRVSGMLMSIVAIILLIACANVANVLLARATSRRREIAVRHAVGASRRRIVRQLLTESVALGLAGGAAGLLLGFWMLDLLTSSRIPVPFPVPDGIGLDGYVLTFTSGLSVATGVLFGLAPALVASRSDAAPVLKNEAVPVESVYRRLGLRKVLVVLEVGLSLVALITAGLFLRSLRQAQGVDPGFETDKVLVMTFNLGREGFTPARGSLFYRDLSERVLALPGIRSATVAQNRPFAGGILRSVFFEGEDTATRDRVLIQVNYVGLRYFETLGIPLIRGRDFSDQDKEGSLPVVIVNQEMANRFWPGKDPVGQRFRFFGEDEPSEVIGVVADAKYGGLVEEPKPFIYEPLLQDYKPAAALHVRTLGEASAMIPAVRGAIQALDPAISVFNIQTLRDRVDGSLMPQRVNVLLLTLFGLVALLLASVGVYGVTAYSVSQRTREIGIRMALGAGRSSVMRMVIRDGMSLVAVGVAAGIGTGLLVTRLIASLLFNVPPSDPPTFATTSVVLAGVAALATYLPARRATKVDPLVALRYE